MTNLPPRVSPRRRAIAPAILAVFAAFAFDACRAPTHDARAATLRPAIKYDMIDIPGDVATRFALARSLGFEGVEIDSPSNLSMAEIAAASKATGIVVHGVIDSIHWTTRFSDPDPAVRARAVDALRGAIESICRAVAGPVIPLEVVAMEPPCQAYDPAAFAGLKLGSNSIGTLGLISAATLKDFGIETPVVAAELHLESLLSFYPPRTHLTPLPAFPAIERDLSLIVGESVTWASVAEALSGAHVQRLEATNFVGTYRGAQVGAGKKSLTLRMRFRDPARTLRHEEVDPQVASVVELMKQRVGAEVRTV